MTGYLSLNLEELDVDATLLARLPAGLAAYYLALPLACEDGAVSVAMAYPENKTALAVLGELLAAPVVPVRASASAIRRTLSRYNGTAGAPPPRVLAWSGDQEHAAAVASTATRFATALGATVTVLTSPAMDLQSVLAVARKGNYSLSAIHPVEAVAPGLLFQQAATPVLLVQDAVQELRHILIVLRGYSADEYALDWLAPLLGSAVSVTLMPLPQPDEDERTGHLIRDGWEHRHLQDCLHHPALRRSRAFVRFRQGEAINQVAEEVRQGVYDLVVIAAEGYGHFVSQLLAVMEQQGMGRQHSFFILKPPTRPATPDRVEKEAPAAEERSQSCVA